MRRRTFLETFATLGAVGLSACSRGPRLNVYNWSDYIAPDTIANFEREFGVAVRYATYESNQEMLAQVMSGNSGWDIVFPSADFVVPMRELALLAQLDAQQLPNRKALEKTFAAPPWDPELRWSIPYMHGATGILYQKSRMPEPRAWEDLWDTTLQGKITMLDDAPEVFAACLKKLGRSLNSGDSTELNSAKNEALKQKPLLRAYLNAEVRDQAVSGDVIAAQAWAVTAAQAIAAAPGKLGFAYPKEGFPRFADNAVILRESRSSELAHQFINYLLRPEVAASIALTTHTATANGEAQRLLPAKVREDPVLYPLPDVYAKAEWFQPQSAASQRMRDRLWTEIKSA
ncbi:MAG: spermidine/putrescine ABC transporter substrate-binding protein [Bryobacteraceae bacterium]